MRRSVILNQAKTFRDLMITNTPAQSAFPIHTAMTAMTYGATDSVPTGYNSDDYHSDAYDALIYGPAISGGKIVSVADVTDPSSWTTFINVTDGPGYLLCHAHTGDGTANRVLDELSLFYIYLSNGEASAGKIRAQVTIDDINVWDAIVTASPGGNNNWIKCVLPMQNADLRDGTPYVGRRTSGPLYFASSIRVRMAYQATINQNSSWVRFFFSNTYLSGGWNVYTLKED